MPSSSLPKNLSLCFSIIKRPRLSSPNSSSSSSAAASEDLRRPSSATSSQPPSYINTYNSLYETKSSSSDHSSDEEMLDAGGGAAPDLASLYASHRFFFSSPGRSNSIVDSSESSTSSESECTAGGVAVQTYSPDPYEDFRRSMEEMVEARGMHDVRGNWKSLHQLLLCYLSLNPKPAHPFIVAAFSDLVVSLLTEVPPAGAAICRCSSSH